MARVGLKVHVQVPLLNRKGSGPSRGRDRRGLRRAPRRADGVGPRPVGRPRKAGRRNTEHRSRPEVRASRPVHVVLRVVREVGNLRRRDGYQALRKATVVVARRGDGDSAAGSPARSARLHGDIRRAGREFGIFRIIHLSIQRDHVHLLVEADDRVALARGLQAFQISAAKHLNAAVRGLDGRRRRGRVFGDRYHASVITSPRQARSALAYVLNNWRKHRADRGSAGWRVDPYSTAASFDGWRAWDLGRDGSVETGWRRPPDDKALVAWPPRSWLLRVGWERHGPIAVAEVPSRPSWL